jgi:hypothetical protein
MPRAASSPGRVCAAPKSKVTGGKLGRAGMGGLSQEIS